MTVAVVGNPTSNKGKGAKVGEQVVRLLQEAGAKHGFDVIDVTGLSFEDSLRNARTRKDEYDYLVVVGGDGMIALGANAVGLSGKPLGIVATGSGNDFARGLNLPVNRVNTAVEGIVGAIVCGTYIDVDMGLATSLPGGYAVDPNSGEDGSRDECGRENGNGRENDGDSCGSVTSCSPATPQGTATVKRTAINRFYAGMLSCGLDASINDRANHSRLPNGSLRYFAAVIVELTHMRRYGYHVKATLADGSVEERDIISPLLTVANSRHIGGESRFLRTRGFRTACWIWCGSIMCRTSWNASTRSCAPTMAGCLAARRSVGSVCVRSRSARRRTVRNRR